MRGKVPGIKCAQSAGVADKDVVERLSAALPTNERQEEPEEDWTHQRDGLETKKRRGVFSQLCLRLSRDDLGKS